MQPVEEGSEEWQTPPSFTPIKPDANAKIGHIMIYEGDASKLPDTHFAVIILKDKSGKEIQSVMQKLGSQKLNREMADPKNIKSGSLDYFRKNVSNTGASIFRPNEVVRKDLNDFKEQ